MNADDARAEQARVEALLRSQAAEQRKEFKESFAARILKRDLKGAYFQVEALQRKVYFWRGAAIGFALLALVLGLR